MKNPVVHKVVDCLQVVTLVVIGSTLIALTVQRQPTRPIHSERRHRPIMEKIVHQEVRTNLQLCNEIKEVVADSVKADLLTEHEAQQMIDRCFNVFINGDR